MTTQHTYQNENEFRDKILERLSIHFDVLKKEAHCKLPQYRNKLRIDAIITPKDKTGWKNQDVIFGVEFKHPMSARGVGDMTRLVCQAIAYSWAVFDTYGCIPVVICPGVRPSIAERYGKISRHQTNGETTVGYKIYHDISRILGKHDIYELRNHNYYGYSIWHNGDHRIWSERNGVEDGRYMCLTRKFGNTNRKINTTDEEE